MVFRLDTMQRPLPPHVITPDELPTWLADSALPEPVWHLTSAGNADAIYERGVRVDVSGSLPCRGFYCSLTPWEPLRQRSTALVEVAARVFNPFRVRGVGDIRVALDMFPPGFSEDDVTKRLLDEEYDCVLTETGWGNQPIIILLVAEQTRVVVRD